MSVNITTLRALADSALDGTYEQTCKQQMRAAADEIERLREANHHYRDAADEARKLREQLVKARAALTECEETLRLVEQPAFVDPDRRLSDVRRASARELWAAPRSIAQVRKRQAPALHLRYLLLGANKC